MKTLVKRIFFIIVLPLILANCVGTKQSSSLKEDLALSSSEPSAKDSYNVLMILPNPEQHHTLQKDLQKAAQMAFYDLNADKINLMFHTSVSDDSVSELISKIKAEQIDIILGPVFSKQTLALKRYLAQTKTPIITYSNDKTLAGNGTYLFGFEPSQQVKQVVNYALKKDHKKFGAFLPNTPYGKHIYNALFEHIRQIQTEYSQKQNINRLDTAELTTDETTNSGRQKFLESGLIEEVRMKFDMPYSDPTHTDEPSEAPEIIDVVFYEPMIADIQKKVTKFSYYDQRKKAFEAFIKPYNFLVETKLAIDTKQKSQTALSNNEMTIAWLIEKYGEREYERVARYHERHKHDETIGEIPYDAILMADSGKQMQMIAAMMPFYNIEPDQVQFLGTGLWDDPHLGEESAIQNAWFAAPSPQKEQKFEERFKHIYGYKPTRLASLAYDSVAMLVLLSKTQTTHPFTQTALTQMDGFEGINGAFRLLPEGFVERELPILAVTQNGPEIIAETPSKLY